MMNGISRCLLIITFVVHGIVLSMDMGCVERIESPAPLDVSTYACCEVGYLFKTYYEKISCWYDEQTDFGKSVDEPVKARLDTLVDQLKLEMSQVHDSCIVQDVMDKIKVITQKLYLIECTVFPDQKHLRAKLLRHRLSTEGLKMVVRKQMEVPAECIKIIAAGSVLKDLSTDIGNQAILQMCRYKIFAHIKPLTVVPTQLAPIGQGHACMSLYPKVLEQAPRNAQEEKITCQWAARLQDVSTAQLKAHASSFIGVPVERIVLIASGRTLKDGADTAINRAILQKCNYKIYSVVK